MHATAVIHTYSPQLVGEAFGEPARGALRRKWPSWVLLGRFCVLCRWCCKSDALLLTQLSCVWKLLRKGNAVLLDSLPQSSEGMLPQLHPSGEAERG